MIFDSYNTILHYSDNIYAKSIIYGVESQTIFRLDVEGNQKPGGKEIKSRSTLCTPESVVSSGFIKKKNTCNAK